MQPVAGGGLLTTPPPTSATSIYFNDITGVAADSAGNFYFGGGTDDVVYKVSGGTVSIVAGTRSSAGYSGDGGPATSAKLSNPQGVAVDSAGNLYIADYQNYAVRKVSTDGTISTIAGNGSFGRPVAGPATATSIYNPIGVAADNNGNVYVSVGTAGGYILKIANGTLSIVAGNGILGDVTNGAMATTQPVGSPHFIAVDATGNVYVTAQYNSTILKVTISDGTIATVAGNGNYGYTGDGGPATSAAMSPFGVAVDSSGNLFLADTPNGVIREVSNGVITTVAGGGSQPCMPGAAIPAGSAYFNNPAGIAFGGGSVYFADAQCVYKLGGGATSGPPSIRSGGVISASAFGQFTTAAPGSWIEIYGSNLAAGTRSWATSDFTGANGVNAPTSLDGTRVTIGGVPAYIDYISPTQVNAQVPAGVTSGSQAVVITAPSGGTAQSTINIAQTAPGLLAPSQFSINGTQYLGATFSDGVTYVLPSGAITGIQSRPAHAGDTIILYGVGFGPVTPNIPAGQTATAQNQLQSTLQITIGGAAAQSAYAGLAPGYVGLYQFNVVVPNVAAGNSVPVTFTLGGVKGAQTLYTAVQ